MPWISRLDDFAKYKKKGVGVQWTSDPFFTTVTGYKLCLQVYPGGDSETKGTHISVYTTLQCGSNDDILSWPFDKTVKVTLLNQLENRFHCVDTTSFKNAIKESVQIMPGAQSATGWGKGKFISHADLNKAHSRNCQYLKDDCLFFKVEIK
jgi:hypothetical protein